MDIDPAGLPEAVRRQIHADKRAEIAPSRAKRLQKVRFFVPGTPAPAGSKKAFINPKTHRPIITDACKRSKPWKDSVKAVAFEAMHNKEMFGHGIALDVAFYFVLTRPKGHFGTGRNADRLKPSAPRFPAIRPDLLKYARAVEDACTTTVYYDDAQIVAERLFKNYGAPEGVWVEVKMMGKEKPFGWLVEDKP